MEDVFILVEDREAYNVLERHKTLTKLPMHTQNGKMFPSAFIRERFGDSFNPIVTIMEFTILSE